jgi:uncharacterized protein (DUF2062 family)
MKIRGVRDLFIALLYVKETPERTAMAFSIGVFLGYSPFLGFHTVLGLALAFVLKVNRVPVLLGVWSNMPWWVIPYYAAATWTGMKVTGFHMDPAALKELVHLGVHGGFLEASFWSRLGTQAGFLISFGVGSTLLALILSLAVYPVTLKGIRAYRRRNMT